jgi:hypothetical protein
MDEYHQIPGERGYIICGLSLHLQTNAAARAAVEIFKQNVMQSAPSNIRVFRASPATRSLASDTTGLLHGPELLQDLFSF